MLPMEATGRGKATSDFLYPNIIEHEVYLIRIDSSPLDPFLLSVKDLIYHPTDIFYCTRLCNGAIIQLGSTTEN